METFVMPDNFYKVLTKYDFMMNFNAFRRSICVKEANL